MRALGTGRVKKSYSISPEAEQFVRRMRKARKIGSESETVDQLLRESMLAHSARGIDAAYTSYFDGATSGDLEVEAAWGAFIESEVDGLPR